MPPYLESADRKKALVKQMLPQCIAEQIYVGNVLMCHLRNSIQNVWHPTNRGKKKQVTIVVVKILWFAILLLSDYPVTVELEVFFVKVFKSFTFVYRSKKKKKKHTTVF